MFNKTHQTQIIEALETNGVDTSQVEFKSKTVVITLTDFNPAYTPYAKAGLFSFMKQDAWAILAALGSSVSLDGDDIDYFAYETGNGWLGRFEIAPDPSRYPHQVKPLRKQIKGNWDIARARVIVWVNALLQKGVEVAEAAGQAVDEFYHGLNGSQAARLLVESVGPVDQRLADLYKKIESVKMGFTDSECCELMGLTLAEFKSHVQGFLDNPDKLSSANFWAMV